MRPSIALALSWSISFASASAVEPPSGVLDAIHDHMLNQRIGESSPGLLANSRIDGSLATTFTIGWAIPGLGAPGDRIWEVPLVESDELIVAVYWHQSTTGVTRTIVTESVSANDSLQEAKQEEPLLRDAPDLTRLAIPDQVAAERAIRDLAPAVLAAGRRVIVLPMIRSYIAIPGLCEAGAWVWPCRIVTGANEVHGLYWLDAASGTAKPIIVGP